MRKKITGIGMKSWIALVLVFLLGLQSLFFRVEKSPVIENQERLGGSNQYVQITGIKKGIDVSRFQGTIDWGKVKNAGIEFAFIQVAYRERTDGTLHADSRYKENIENAIAVGMPIGVYFFSQAITEQEAIEEAEYITNLISNYPISLPVVIDYEFKNCPDGTPGRLEAANITKQQGTAICKAFCKRVEEKGYRGMVYASRYYLGAKGNESGAILNGPEIANDYLIWMAEYISENKTTHQYVGNFDFWQFTSKGLVDGIDGYVDLDYWYVKDYAENFIDSGLYYYGDKLGWCYFNKGSIDTSYTGLAYNPTVGWWYVKNGRLDTSYTGFASNEYGYWWCENGTVAHNKTGVVYGWNHYRYVKNGQVDFGYTGMAYHPWGGWMYFENGEYNPKYTGMANNEYGWWYFSNGKLDNRYTGYACNEYGYWWFENGQIARNKTGMVYGWGIWRYIKNGKVDFGYTGMANNENGWWYFTNGDLNWNYTGMALNEYGWWYYQNGRLDWNYTGMANNENGWWYYRNGQIDWGYTGYAANEYGYWWYENGQIAWNKTGMVYDWGIWRYIKNGKVDFGYTGMALNEYGWWYFSNGDLNWNYTGPASNEYGNWYFENGRLVW